MKATEIRDSNSYDNKFEAKEIIDLVERQTAFVLAQNCYREMPEGLVEDYHASCTMMNLSIYKEIKDAFITELKDNVREIRKFRQGDSLFQTLAKAYNSFMRDNQTNCFALLSYIGEGKFILKYVLSCVLANRLKGWDNAVLIDVKDVPNGLVTETDYEKAVDFILGGEFLNICIDKECLSDYNMKIINKDIHNRLYTLVVNKIIPLPFNNAFAL